MLKTMVSIIFFIGADKLNHADRLHRAGFGAAGTAGAAIVVIQNRVGFSVAVNIGFAQDNTAKRTIPGADAAGHADIIINDRFFRVSHG